MADCRLPESPKVFSVTELTLMVKGVLEEVFPAFWVAGEISNITRPGSGHIYLTLKDADAQLRCVMWRSAARGLRFKPVDGLQVLVRGRLTVYPQRGDYQHTTIVQVVDLSPASERQNGRARQAVCPQCRGKAL